MTDQNPLQFQKRQQDTVLNMTENLFLDKQTLFNKLQYPLSKIECQKKVIQQICSQLVSEEIFDPVVVNKYISTDGDGDFRQLVWEFRNEEHKTFLKFLEILKNLNDYPVTCKKFQKVITKVITENHAAKESNIFSSTLRFLERKERQVLSRDDIILFNQSNIGQENEKFLYNGEIQAHKSIVKSKHNQKPIFAAFITGVTILIAGFLLYLSLRPKFVANSHDITSTIQTPINFIEDQLAEYSTIDPKTVEIKVNESLYTYNFL